MANLKVRLVAKEGAPSNQSFHGMDYPLRFDEEGICVVDEADYDQWVKPHAAKQGIFVVGPTTEKSPQEKHLAELKKAPATKVDTKVKKPKG